MTYNDAYHAHVEALGTGNTVSGVAIGEGDTSRGMSEKPTYWPGDVLRDAADKLVGVPIVKGHPGVEKEEDGISADAAPPLDAKVGEVTDAQYEPGEGLVWQGEVKDDEMLAKIRDGLAHVSPVLGRELKEREDGSGFEATEIKGFRDLGLVSRGAAPSNNVEMGAAMSADALAEVWDGVEALKEKAGVEFTGTAEGELDESEIPNDNYESHYLYPGDTKSESSYPVVDADGNLRRGNVDAAHQLGCRGMCPSDETHDEKLMALAEEFENPPEWATEDGEAMSGAQVKDPALWEACSLSLPGSLVDDSGGNPGTEDSPENDDGSKGGMGQSSAGADDVQDTTTMTDELSESEKAILSAAESVEDPTEALEQFAAADNPKLVEQDTYEALNNAVETLDGMMAEALTEEFGLREGAVEAMSFEAKAAQFENDDGDFEAEALVQEPETGDPEESESGTEALSEDADVEKAEALYEDMNEFGVDHKDTIQEALGVDEWDTAVEVLD